MGYVKRGDLMVEVEKVVFNLREGDISPLMQTAQGYYIFKVEEKDVSATVPLSQARHKVEEAVYNSKADAKIKGWLEGLKKNAYIAFK